LAKREKLNLADNDKEAVEAMAMADLMCLGYNETDAYLITHRDQRIFGDDFIRTKIANIVSTPEFIKYSEKRARAMKRDSAKIEEDPDDTSDQLPDKEKVARELWTIAKSLPVGSKERAEVASRYADLMQMKKDVVEEEDTIHYYLPLSCDKCELYLSRKKGKKSTNEEQTINSEQ
jgi:hypothetical protein